MNDSWVHDSGDHVAAIAWSGDGHFLAAAPATGGIALLERSSGRVIHAFPGHALGNCAISASPVSPLLASAGQDGLTRLWDTISGRLCCELPASDSKNAWCEHTRFSPDGTLLATAAGRVLRIWSTAGSLVFESKKHDSTIAAIAWRPDSSGIATGCYNGVRLFRAKDGFWEPDCYEYLQWKGSIISLTWSPSGRYVAGGSQESTIQFWRLPYRPGEELFMSGYATKVRELAWDSSSRFLATGGGEIAMVWDVSGRGPAGRKPRELEGHTGRISQLAFQHRGPLLASGAADGRVFVMDLKSAQRHRHELKPPSLVTSLAWSPCDTALAFGTASGSVSVWEARPA